MEALKHVHPPLGELCCGLSCDLSCDLLYTVYCGDQKLSGSVGRAFDDITGFAELVCLKRSCELRSDVNFVLHKGLTPLFAFFLAGMFQCKAKAVSMKCVGFSWCVVHSCHLSRLIATDLC